MNLAREDLGTKRVCPETHKKFYDLGKDPIVSPYTGKEYPRSYFEEVVPAKVRREAPRPVKDDEENEVEAEEEEDELEDESGPEFVSLEDAEEDEDPVKESASDDGDEDDELPDLPDVDIEVEEDEDVADDAFLEEEEEDDDLSDVIGDVDGEEEV